MHSRFSTLSGQEGHPPEYYPILESMRLSSDILIGSVVDLKAASWLVFRFFTPSGAFDDPAVQFIAMAGIELLAFCSSQDMDLSRRLNVPQGLVGLTSTVLVSLVKIENYSAYAEAAVKADYVRW
jgi:hypothetical protein